MPLFFFLWALTSDCQKNDLITNIFPQVKLLQKNGIFCYLSTSHRHCLGRRYCVAPDSGQYSSFHLRSTSLASCLLVWTHFLYLPLSPLQLLIFYRSCQLALKFTQVSPNLGKGNTHTHTHTHTHIQQNSLFYLTSQKIFTLYSHPPFIGSKLPPWIT